MKSGTMKSSNPLGLLGPETEIKSSLSRLTDGQIDQLAIFQLAFNSTQISSLYNSGNGVSNWTIMPISKSYWEFNEGSGTTASAFGSAASDMTLLSSTGNPVQWVGGLTD